MNKSKHTFFCPDLDSGMLDEIEAGHALRVLRLQVGDQITVINGKGRKLSATILESSKKSLTFEPIQEIEGEAIKIPLHIAIAPTKSNDRFNFFLEKCTEMGLSAITPLKTSNSERKVFKTEKGVKTLVSALKQSGNLYLPDLSEQINFKEFISQEFGASKKFIAHCENDPSKVNFKDCFIEKNEDVLILIGPEGDFTQEEINLAKEKDFTPVSLGNSRLRTETAGIIACHTAYLQY